MIGWRELFPSVGGSSASEMIYEVNCGRFDSYKRSQQRAMILDSCGAYYSWDFVNGVGARAFGTGIFIITRAL